MTNGAPLMSSDNICIPEMNILPDIHKNVPLDKRVAELLENRLALYNRPSFIEHDPICVPHQFSRKEDREIAAFLTATIAWGNRKSIVQSSLRIMQLMDNSPAAFIRGFSETDLRSFRGFVHRTFNETDLVSFCFALKNIYQHHEGMEAVFYEGAKKWNPGAPHQGFSPVKTAIVHFRNVFFSIPHQKRSRKHVSDPGSGSATKRLNMMLRWLVRKDDAGVDLGIWDSFSAADLYCPLDVHSGRVARRLGLLQRRQNDWKAVEELTSTLRLLDPADPVKYDFALFGMGVFEKIS